MALQRKPEMGKAAHTLTNHGEAEKGIRRTIRYRKPPVLLLNVELIGETVCEWVLRIIHLCFVVWRLYTLFDLLGRGLGGIRHIWLPAAGADFLEIPWSECPRTRCWGEGDVYGTHPDTLQGSKACNFSGSALSCRAEMRQSRLGAWQRHWSTGTFPPNGGGEAATASSGLGGVLTGARREGWED